MIVEVGELSTQIRGISYSQGDAIQVFREGYVPILRANNITDEGLNFEDLIYVPREIIKEHQLLRKGDILIAASSGSKRIVGKAAFVKSDISFSFGAFCKVIRPNRSIDFSYFSYYFQTPDYRQKISALSAGANINNLKNEHLNKLKIPLPPLETQRKIATILNKADEMWQNNKKILEKYDQLVQSVFLKMFGDFEENPFGFKQGMLGDFVNKKGGIICGPFGSQLKIGEFINIGIPVYGIDNVQKNKFIDAKPKYITEEKYIFLKSFTVSGGDILVTRTGTVGRTCVAPNNIPKAVIGPNLLRIRLIGNELLPIFLSFTFNYSTSIIRQIAMFSPGATVAVYNTGNLKKLNILVPPIELQERFVKVYMQIDGQKKLTQKSLQKSEELFQSLLQRAFKGELI